MKALNMVAWILLIVGGLNWGLIGLGDWNVVMNVFGEGSVTNVVYILVGLSALVALFNWPKKSASM
ncbi:MAG TPA: DUF378 domain-containing protein [Candidatus Paceibacterota bacterium]|nr:DUF378 domain-containing protein [Candidatus Paceibacterota bacterium]